MTRESAHLKGRRYLTEGRLTIHAATRELGVFAVVQGDSGENYKAAWSTAMGWSCDCPARSDACAHLVALRLVTVTNLDDRKDTQ